MANKRIYPGEMFIVEYVDGGFVNRWAVNASKDYIELGTGRKASAGFTDVLVKKESGVELVEQRYHILSNIAGLKFISDDGFRTQTFANIALSVLKVKNQTDIFDRSGVKIGTIPAGCEIGTDGGDAGYSKRFLMVANAFNDGSGWKFLNQNSYSYGFVNIEQAFDLTMYNSTRAVVSVKSERGIDPDWALIGQVAKTNAPEIALRGDLSAKTKDEIINLVNDHFASVDLKDAVLGDPVAFFMNEKNRVFVKNKLQAVDPAKATAFDTESLAFKNRA